MNDPAFSSYGNSEEEHGSYVSTEPENSFRSTLNNLQPQEPKPRKQRETKKLTAKKIVAEYYFELETARVKKHYAYSDLSRLIRDELGHDISPETLKKYMTELRKKHRNNGDYTDIFPLPESPPNTLTSSNPAPQASPSQQPKSPIHQRSKDNGKQEQTTSRTSPPLEQPQQTQEEQKQQTPPRRVPSHLNVSPEDFCRKTRTYE